MPRTQHSFRFLSSAAHQTAARAVLLRQLLQLYCEAGNLYMQEIKRASELHWGASYWYFDTFVFENQFGIDHFPKNALSIIIENY